MFFISMMVYNSNTFALSETKVLFSEEDEIIIYEDQYAKIELASLPNESEVRVVEIIDEFALVVFQGTDIEGNEIEIEGYVAINYLIDELDNLKNTVENSEPVTG